MISNDVEKLTLLKALKLSEEKWEIYSNFDYKSHPSWGPTDWKNFLDDWYPQFQKYPSGCALCEKFQDCAIPDCPLDDPAYGPKQDNHGCLRPNHPFELWGADPSRENAKRMLSMIRKAIVKENEKI